MIVRRLVALLAALALGLAACGEGDPVDVDDAEGPADEEAAGTLRAAISGQPDRLDPHQTSAYPSFQVLENIYDTLVEPDEELVFQPALAEDWEVSDDQLTWTFSLREGVTFHNGQPFTADDVVYSYERIIDENLANAFRFEAVQEIRAVDDLTVEIEVSAPTPNLLSNIGAFKGMAIIPAGSGGEEVDAEDDAGDAPEDGDEADEPEDAEDADAPEDGEEPAEEEMIEETDLDLEPVGTGPFQWAGETADGVALDANPDYWGDGPFVDRVEFQFIAEGTVALTALQTGEVHWTDNIPPQQIPSLEGDDEVEMESVPSNDFWYFAANIEREPFDDVRVRQALSYGIDREAVTTAAMFEAATVNQTGIPEGSFWHHDYAPFEYDPDRAAELLEEAGVDDLEIDLMVTNEFEETIQAAQIMESQLGEIGVDVSIRTLDFAGWLDDQAEGNFDVFLLGWLGNIDPDDYYYAQHHSGGGFNFHGYANPQVDELLDAGRTEIDEDARKAIYDEMVEIIVDEVSYAFLYNPDVVHAWRPELADYTTRADRAIRFRGVSLES